MYYKQGRFLKKNHNWLSQKNIENVENLDINKKKINFVVNRNSIGKILWYIQLGRGRLLAPKKTLVNTLISKILCS